MAGGIVVTPEQLQSVSGQLNSGAANVESLLQQLASQVEPLGADWAGAGALRFQELWQDWQTSAGRLHMALTEIAQLMAQAGARYEETDANVARGFQQ